MNKAIHIEQAGKTIERILSIAEPDILQSNPTNREYFLIEDYTDPPELDNPLSINYPMYDKINQKFKWVQVQYQNTATEEIFEIENLKLANVALQNELQEAQENIDMLIELQADILGGAIE